MFSQPNSSVLDVGCGEGAISDFLTPAQKAKYVGIDISKEAVHMAKSRRGAGGQRFFHSTAHKFEPAHKYDIIIFSEVLYYVEYEKIIDQYLNYLAKDGIMVISIFHVKEQLLYTNIWEYARRKMKLLDEVDLRGKVEKSSNKAKEDTALHIEVYQKLSNPENK
jgi:2-polyprenyl-3-methyl-5-hydroxy-6-metoxy-1,4-benzoquinol methylase